MSETIARPSPNKSIKQDKMREQYDTHIKHRHLYNSRFANE